MFALQNAPLPAADLPGLALAAEEPPSRNAKFDLTFALVHAGDGLAAAIEYATDLFDPPTIVALRRAVARAARRGAVERPGAALAALPLLAAGQRHQVLQEWNDTARAWGDDPALHQLFERQAGLRPEAPAGDLPRGDGHLRRAGGAGEPPGPPPAAPWGCAAASRSGSGWSARSTCSPPCSAS